MINALSVAVWVLSIVLLTNYIGNIPAVQQHFTEILSVLAAIVALLLLITGVRWALHQLRH